MSPDDRNHNDRQERNTARDLDAHKAPSRTDAYTVDAELGFPYPRTIVTPTPVRPEKEAAA